MDNTAGAYGADLATGPSSLTVTPGYVPRQRSNQRLPVTVSIVDDLGQQVSGALRNAKRCAAACLHTARFVFGFVVMAAAAAFINAARPCQGIRRQKGSGPFISRLTVAQLFQYLDNHAARAGSGVGTDMVVSVMSGNATLTAGGQTRVAAFNGSATFSALTVRAPTQARPCTSLTRPPVHASASLFSDFELWVWAVAAATRPGRVQRARMVQRARSLPDPWERCYRLLQDLNWFWHCVMHVRRCRSLRLRWMDDP